MSTERKGLEIYVGLFLFIGLAVIAIMVVTFGRVGRGLKKTYPIIVEFPNASGLIKDSDVLLSGARIGTVADNPKLIGKSFTVQVRLNIREDVKIPRKSAFLVGSSGLLGDRYVDVIPQPDFDPADVAQPGELIQGTRAAGLDDLTQKGGVVMDQLIKELEDIQKITVQLHQGLLSDQNLKNLSDTFANLKTTSVNLSTSSQKLDPIFTKADAAVDSAKSTMKTADEAAADLKKAVAELQRMAGSATKTIDSAKSLVDSGKSLLDKANNGQGALGLLLSDRETATNLRALISNMRRSGPVFYKDREPAATPKPIPRR
jgi:phospholipid/cholesterol/gamma-HCH transport system substrate-binding protein